ncbi:hypothetical protein ACIQM0_26940 [Streptomyces sp. NPDC091387]|uniref:hypothetical protein n=1 Tax=Streptomyces sp. NPDC091387 TaxID=3365998 RepID=UPI00382AF5A2
MADDNSVALARGLITSEYGLRDREPGRKSGAGDKGSIWAQLADQLKRFMDRITGRSRSASQSEPTSAPAMSASAASAPAMSAEVQQSAPISEQQMPGSVAGFRDMIGRLPEPQREAFEDEVLHQVRSNKTWRDAYDASPMSMPMVAEYANNAYERELLRDTPGSTAVRDRWERQAPAPGPSTPPFPGPGPNEFIDGHNFAAAGRGDGPENSISAFASSSSRPVSPVSPELAARSGHVTPTSPLSVKGVAAVQGWPGNSRPSPVRSTDTSPRSPVSGPTQSNPFRR